MFGLAGAGAVAGLLLAGILPAPAADGDSNPARPAGGRPTIGLVLGGGGALGAAHVGVLKVLEELRIPIDYVGGTSMGAIIGGLYSAGLSPDEIAQFLNGIDWWEVLKDGTPRRELAFRRKQDDQRFLFNMELGIKGGKIKLPVGMASGQKFNNLMQWMVMRAGHPASFDQLPLPYRAVAVDLYSGERVVLDRGNLATAMRASMAVPGVFTPVAMDGKLLVDGGVLDNVPVDAVKAMGADIIIAVDLGATSEAESRKKLDSLGGVVGRVYSLVQRPGQLESLTKADIAIAPDLTGFSASQFEKSARIMPRGETAAREKADKLKAYSVDEETWKRYLARQRRTDLPPPVISGVEVKGESRVDERAIRGRITTEPGDLLTRETVDTDLLRVFGLGDFEQVLFRANPGGDGKTELEYQVKEKPWGPDFLRVGLQLRTNFDQETDWGVLLNYTKANLNSLGAEWRNDFQLGSPMKLLTEYYQPLDYKGFLFLAPSAQYRSDLAGFYDDDRRIAEYEMQTVQANLDVGLQLRHYAELRIGPYFAAKDLSVKTGASDLKEGSENIAGWRARLAVDRQDRTIIPSTGYQFWVEGVKALEDMGSDSEYEKVSARYQQILSRGDHTFQFSIQGGSSLDTDVPVYDQFTLGGAATFFGLAEGQLRGPYMGSGSVGYRFRLSRLSPNVGRGVYALVRFDAGNVWEDEDDAGFDDLVYGGGGGILADTALGAIYLGYGQTDSGSEEFYFSLGTAF